jgi:CheY-like chemotaxis protein
MVNALGTKPLAGIRVLVVEDDADTRETLVAWLESQGADVRSAGSAAEAVAAARDGDEILLSDIGLPCEDGFALLRRLQSQAGDHRVRAAAVTASVDGLCRQKAREAGFSFLIPKPFDPARLVDVVRGLFQERRRQVRPPLDRWSLAVPSGAA